jgi:leucyl aminopeptidase
MDIKFSNSAPKTSELLVVQAYDGGQLGAAGKELDEAFGGFVSGNIASDKSFSAKRGQTLVLGAPVGSPYKKLVVLGMGEASALDDASCSSLGSVLSGTLSNLGAAQANILMDEGKDQQVPAEKAAALMADGLLRKSYKFNKYKTDSSNGSGPQKVTFSGSGAAKARKIFEPLHEATKGSFLAADLANEPANVLYPESFVKRIKDELEPLGVKVKVLDEKKMKALGMEAALSVGQGSEKNSYMAVMEYDGAHKKDEPWQALVGKGVTFDTGGISIKPSGGMSKMKMDMGGAAAVVGGMRALAGRKSSAKIVSIVGLVENMPSGNATRPGDIIRSMSGKTVEINNTDAEGRLVLIDALTYIQNEYNPESVVDFATLTGACAVALGTQFAGVFTNDKKLWKKLNKAGKQTDELVHRMPLHESFARAVKGKFADLNNSAGAPGASTAAEFLHAVIDTDKNGNERKWAHVDIAGPAIPADGISKGYGARLINQYVENNYEKPAKARGPKAPKP